MKLLYLWLENENTINSVDISFASKVKFEYLNGYLIISDNLIYGEIIYEDFSNITSIHGLIGENGAGKSSILRCISNLVEGKDEKTNYIMIIEDKAKISLISNLCDFTFSNINYGQTKFKIDEIIREANSYFKTKEVKVIYYSAIIDYMDSMKGKRTIDISTNRYLSEIKMSEDAKLAFEQFEVEWDKEALEYIFSENNDEFFFSIKSLKLGFNNDFYDQEVTQHMGNIFEALLENTKGEMRDVGSSTIEEFYKTHIIKIIREYVQTVIKGSTKYIDDIFRKRYATDFKNAYNYYLTNFADARDADTEKYPVLTEDDNHGYQTIDIYEIISKYEEQYGEISKNDKTNIVDSVNAIIGQLEKENESWDSQFVPEQGKNQYLDEIHQIKERLFEAIEFEDSEVVVEYLTEFIRLIPQDFDYSVASFENVSVSDESINEPFIVDELEQFKKIIIEVDELLSELLINPTIVDQQLGICEFDLRESYEKVYKFYHLMKQVEIFFKDVHNDVSLISYELPKLSTGERYYYELMSRIMKCKDMIKGKDLIVLIDEGDVFLHPNAQRQFVEKLLKHLNLHSVSSINLIIASNSPFIVSDMTRDRLTLLDSGKNDITRTFGANIHEILATDFFMEKTVGSLSYSKIFQISEDITNGTVSDRIGEYKAAINAIGENIIRCKLMERIQKIEPMKKTIIKKINHIEDEKTLVLIEQLINDSEK